MTKLHQKIGKIWKDKTGVSPIIAVILMVAITVVLAATIYVWVSGFGGGGSQSISMAVTQRGPATGNATAGYTATFRVDSVSQGTTWGDIEWKTNKTNGSYDDFSGGTDTQIEAGDEFDVTCAAIGNTLTIRDKTSNSIVLTKTIW